MKKNGFIATSLLYTFFLAFITLFIGMITIYLQNRVYLNKLEDSSKNAIYIREIKNKLTLGTYFTIKIDYTDGTTQTPEFISVNNNIFKDGFSNEYNIAKCELIYYENNKYYIEGCPTSWKKVLYL